MQHVKISFPGLRQPPQHRLRSTAMAALLFVIYAQGALAADPPVIVAAANGATVVAAATTTTTNVPTSNGLVAVEFDRALMFGGGRNQVRDLSQFAHGNPLLPGTFRSDVYLNSRWLGRLDVVIAKRNNVLGACFDRDFIARFGLDVSLLSEPAQIVMGLNKAATAVAATEATAKTDAAGASCLQINEFAEGAIASFSSAQQKLDITIPQNLLGRTARNAVSPDLWDDGINAGFANYNYNAFRTSNGGVSQMQQYLGLNTGLNLNGWYLRHDGGLRISDAGKRTYQSVGTYVRRDVSALKAAVTLGDGYTDGQLFDSIGFRGVMLTTDERMLPSSQRGYAPVIRGQARSNAKVNISQNGITLYETSVPAGAFVIDDLYPTGFGGDLVTTITEADGTTHAFNTPFTSTPQLLREDGLRYQIVGGAVRSAGLQARSLAIGTVQYGLNNTVTVNGGATVTPEYTALLAGSAFSTPIGAASLDLTNSRFVEPGVGVHVGNSLRAGFTTQIPVTLTNFTLATYRYSSRDYYNLRDAMTALSASEPQSFGGFGYGFGTAFRARDRSQISISQTIDSSSALYLSGSTSSYWNSQGRQSTYQVGYSRRFGTTQMQVSASRQTTNGVPENQVSVSFSFPLGEGNNTQSIGTGITHDSRTGTSAQASLSGVYGEEQQFQYNANTSKSPTTTTAGVSGNWRAAAGTFGASASTGTGTSQESLSATGGILLHSSGMVFTPTLGQSMALIQAPDAVGAAVNGAQGATIDGSGYGVAPFLSPYELNDVGVNISKLSADVQLTSTSQQAVPRAGAIVAVTFKGQTGRWLVIKASQPGGRALPFGADVFDAQDRSVGSVGQNSRIDARVADDAGTLRVQWGKGAAEQCRLDYQAPAKVAGAALTSLQGLVCQPLTKGPIVIGENAVKEAAPPKAAPAPATKAADAAKPSDRLVISATLDDGTPVPAGANVSSAASADALTSVVASGGRFVMRSPSRGLPLAVRWGADGESGCVISQLRPVVPGIGRSDMASAAAVCKRDVGVVSESATDKRVGS